MEGPAAVWEAAEKLKVAKKRKKSRLLARLGISVSCYMAHLGHTWEHFTLYRSGDSNAKGPARDLLEALLQIFSFFFLFFAKLWESRKDKAAVFLHDFYTDILHWKLACLPKHGTYLLCHSKRFFMCRCCVIRQLEGEIKCGLRQNR